MRPSIDETLMKVALAWEERSTCSRANVGAIIARKGRHIASGYNGAPAGMPHCEHEGIDKLQIMRKPSRELMGMPVGCRTAIHAEANAIAYAARDGINVFDATVYVTLSPCYNCCLLMIAAGISRVVFHRLYRDQEGIQLLMSADVIVDHLAKV